MTDKRVYEGDEALVEAMLEVRFPLAVGKPLPNAWASYEVAGMTAALRVARESLWAQWAKEKLRPVTDLDDSYADKKGWECAKGYANHIFTFRASAPPAPQGAKPQIVSSCYGDLVRSHPAVAELIAPEEWDNLSASEQRDWALDRIAAKPAERELTDAEWERVRQAFLEVRRSSHIADLVPALKVAYAEIKRILSEPAVDPRWGLYRAANDKLLELRGNVDRLTPEQWEELRKLMPSQDGK